MLEKPSTSSRVLLATREGLVVQAGEGVALLAADLAATHKLHALDAFIYAAALLKDAELVTCEANFKGLPNLQYLPEVNSREIAALQKQ